MSTPPVISPPIHRTAAVFPTNRRLVAVSKAGSPTVRPVGVVVPLLNCICVGNGGSPD
jgi:hypothetical protein